MIVEPARKNISPGNSGRRRPASKNGADHMVSGFPGMAVDLALDLEGSFLQPYARSLVSSSPERVQEHAEHVPPGVRRIEMKEDRWGWIDVTALRIASGPKMTGLLGPTPGVLMTLAGM
jgi:hypothetical protein